MAENLSISASTPASVCWEESQKSQIYGDILFYLPIDSNFDFHLEATYGTIDTEIPFTVTGEIGTQEMKGMINQGGPLLTLITQSANIEINILKTNNN